MDEKTLFDLKYGVFEAYSELFSNEVYYSDLITICEDPLYNEVPNKEYGEPIKLTGKVNLEPKEEEISLVGQTGNVNSTFEIPYYCLEEKGIHTKSLSILKKGKIIFNDIEYLIVNVIPKINIENIFLKYKFECRSVDYE